MASDETARLALPYLAAAQAQKHVTHNEALRRLDAYVQLALESVTALEPPVSPAEGACWFVPAGATGSFAGQDGTLATYEAGAFDFLAVPADTLAFIRDEDRFARHDGSAWVSPLADAVVALAARTQLVLESITDAAPPAAPEAGGRWFVPAGATGAFAGQAGTLAVFQDGAFTFLALESGALAFIRDEWRLALYDGGAWVSPLAVRPSRAAIEAEVLEQDLVLSGTSVATTVAIPARAIVLGVSTRTLSGVTGATSYDCGIAGEASKFGGSLGVAQGAANSGVIGPTAFYAETPVVVTANGGAFTGGRVRVSIHLLRCPVSVFPDLEQAWWTQAEHQLDGVAPALAADFVGERYALGGAHVSSTTLFQRTGSAKMVVAGSGELMQAPANTLAFDYHSGGRRLLLEGAATNLFYPSSAPGAAVSLSVTAQVYTLSFWGTGAMALSGAHVATVSAGGGRTTYTFTPAAGSLSLTPSGTVLRAQLEVGAIATSYIATTTAAVTRTTDICQWSGAAVAVLGGSGVGPNSLVWRGSLGSSVDLQDMICFQRDAVAKQFLRQVGSSIQIITPARGTLFDVKYLEIAAPARFAVCVGWGGDGMAAYASGLATGVTGTRAGQGTVEGIFLGGPSGFPNGVAQLIEDIVVWPLMGSAAALQSQAHISGVGS
ncbi:MULTISPECIES: DUF2793 domain-containing protein [unclassified Xanthobacter]|uniref:DUF2793 domain-containing protein n=1 Tax=unclassified Xanthobacter TaxID=2623496 RepID=UPI001EDD15B1|nr:MULTISPECIES: DUF2793 domain-containing protein [unclassified Xanthobacter]